MAKLLITNKPISARTHTRTHARMHAHRHTHTHTHRHIHTFRKPTGSLTQGDDDNPNQIKPGSRHQTIVVMNAGIHYYSRWLRLLLTLCILRSLANSEDTDEMPHNAPFHQRLHCLL